VLAIVGFVVIRLREFRREAAAGPVTDASIERERMGRHRQR
jgi:hypothetical protein